MNSNINVKSTISKTVEVENLSGSITAQVIINGDTVGSINNGTVKKSGNIVATFNSYGTQNLNINYNADGIDRCAVLTEVEEFINNVNEKGVQE